MPPLQVVRHVASDGLRTFGRPGRHNNIRFRHSIQAAIIVAPDSDPSMTIMDRRQRWRRMARYCFRHDSRYSPPPPAFRVQAAQPIRVYHSDDPAISEPHRWPPMGASFRDRTSVRHQLSRASTALYAPANAGRVLNRSATQRRPASCGHRMITARTGSRGRRYAQTGAEWHERQGRFKRCVVGTRQSTRNGDLVSARRFQAHRHHLTMRGVAPPAQVSPARWAARRTRRPHRDGAAATSAAAARRALPAMTPRRAAKAATCGVPRATRCRRALAVFRLAFSSRSVTGWQPFAAAPGPRQFLTMLALPADNGRPPAHYRG